MRIKLILTKRDLNDAYQEGFQEGLELGILVGETNLKNQIADMEGMDWLLDELDMTEIEDENE